MPRLCSDSSRPYPGRPARHAVLWTAPIMATCSVIRQKSAAAIVGADIVRDGLTIGNEP
ncbi:hypothetical protein ACFL0M_13750 [Thermodesulfobacteriota bacterium]